MKSLEFEKYDAVEAMETGTLETELDVCVGLNYLRGSIEALEVKTLKGAARRYPESFEPDYYLSQYYFYIAGKPDRARKHDQRQNTLSVA